MQLIHTYIDPYAVDPQDVLTEQAAKDRRTLAILYAELDRIDMRIDALYREQTRIPVPDAHDWDDWDEGMAQAESAYDNLYNGYDFKIERLNKRATSIEQTVWEISERLYWADFK